MSVKKTSAPKEKATKQVTETKKLNSEWKKEEFFHHCEISPKDVEDSRLSWEELANIYDEHSNRIKKLDNTARYIADQLREIPQVHTVRTRVKDPAHLVRKIIRKRIEDVSRNIQFNNYQQEITDLIGIRALHLYKGDWLEIHKFTNEEWDTIETPIAYIREGDNSEWTQSYKENGCVVKSHPRKYRSIHYSIKTSASKNSIIAEVQTRTLFEEAWSEIDHQINYPQAVNQNIVALYLELFNRYAGSADEMGSVLQILVNDLRERDFELEKVSSERDEALKKVEELVNKSKMSDAEKTEMGKELQKLRNIQNPLAAATSSATATMVQGLSRIDYSKAAASIYGTDISRAVASLVNSPVFGMAIQNELNKGNQNDS